MKKKNKKMLKQQKTNFQQHRSYKKNIKLLLKQQKIIKTIILN